MSLDVVEKIFERLSETGLLANKLTIVWHAGEPLVNGTEYYQLAIDLIEKIRPVQTTVEYSFQTNGTLINDDWCELFNKYSIKLGLSVDGPKFIHDRHRLTRKGKGSHDKVQQAIELLNSKEIPFYTISVLTDYSLHYAEEMFDYFYQNKILRCGFNVDEVESLNNSSTLDYVGVKEELISFFSQLLTLNANKNYPIEIRELSNAFSIIKAWDRTDPDWLTKSQELVPGKIITVDYLGNFSTFSPELIDETIDNERLFVFGNVYRQDFKKSFNTSKFKSTYKNIKAGIKKCRQNCKYFQFCGGGSPSNKYYEKKTFNCDETLYCKLHRQVPLNVVLNHLESQVKVKDRD